jgi:hypothetical protein
VRGDGSGRGGKGEEICEGSSGGAGKRVSGSVSRFRRWKFGEHGRVCEGDSRVRNRKEGRVYSDERSSYP